MLKVSVIVPSYNHEDFISESITSILNQTFQDFEILILDDCSIDESVEIANKFTDKRISIFVNDENIGSSATMNKLIQLAKGEYIALLNSDDVWEPNKLEKQVDFMENNPLYGAVFTNAMIIDEQGNEITNKEHFYYNVFQRSNRSRFEWLNYFFNIGNCLCHPSILIRKSTYDEVGLYNPLMASLPDFEMWVRVCLKYDIFVMPEKLIRFRILNNEQNASSLNYSNRIRCQFEYMQILNHFLLLTTEDYEKVFNEKLETNLILSLTSKAINKNQSFMQTWGLETLYKFLQNNLEYSKIKEFTKLTSQYDIFNLFKRKELFIQLFIDNGNSFYEEMSIKYEVLESKQYYSFEFDLKDFQNIRNLRLDPLNDSCVIEIEKMYLVVDDGKEIDLTAYISANVCLHHHKSYFFESFDPQIYFKNIDLSILNILKITIEVRYIHIEKDAVHICINQIVSNKDYKINLLIQEIESKNQEIESKNQEIESKNQDYLIVKDELLAIYNSKSWKLTRPFRYIVRKILKGNE